MSHVKKTGTLKYEGETLNVYINEEFPDDVKSFVQEGECEPIIILYIDDDAPRTKDSFIMNYGYHLKNKGIKEHLASDILKKLVIEDIGSVQHYTENGSFQQIVEDSDIGVMEWEEGGFYIVYLPPENNETSIRKMRSEIDYS